MVQTGGYRRSCEYDNIPHSVDYDEHKHCDHECGGCKPPKKDYYPFIYAPTPNEPVKENIFMINDTIPYLVDHTQYRYGPVITASHDLETRIINRKGVSCVNIDAVFDLTENITTNAAWVQYLQQIISMKYESIKEVLDVIKSTIVFRLYYTIKDSDGEEVMRAYCDSPCQCGFLNPVGDVKDYFVTSYKNIFTDMINSVPYSGIYTLTIDSCDAIIKTFSFRDTITPTSMNPYYAFSHNNTHIDVFHDTLQPVTPTEEFVIAKCYVNKSVSFETNVTTKLKVSFVAFMNNAIIVPNTLGIWNSLFDPSEVIIKELRERVEALEDSKEEFVEDIANLRSTCDSLAESIAILTTNFQNLSAVSLDHETRIVALEQSVLHKNAYTYINDVKDYLYECGYDFIDYHKAEEYFKYAPANDAPSDGGGCSSMRVGNYYGRNYDWHYDNNTDIVIKMEKGKSAKYSSIGVAGNVNGLTNDFVKSRQYSELYDILPFRTLDGINECGVIANANVAPIGDYEITTGTTPTGTVEKTISELQLVRFILDNFATATEAVTYIKEHVSVHASPSLLNNELHFMVADSETTYVIEFINNEMVVLYGPNHAKSDIVMTNFYLYQTSLDENNHVDRSTVTDYGCGLERYDILTDSISTIDSVASMKNAMVSVKSTNTYIEDPADHLDTAWVTEFVGGDLKVSSPKEDFIPIMTAAREAYVNRDRDEMSLTWQTLHTSVYDMTTNTLSLWIQEDYNSEAIVYNLE